MKKSIQAFLRIAEVVQCLLHPYEYLSKKQDEVLHQDVNLNKQALKVWVISIK